MTSIAANAITPQRGSNRFFLMSAITMSLIIVAGFSFQFAMGRSSFNAPLLVHAHALVFMGWVAINLLQNIFVSTGNLGLHRKLGWLATGWIAAMVVLGIWITVAMVRRGAAPFFFQPLHFLVFNPLTLLTFVGLTVAAIRLRRHTEWHRRLHFCAMAMLLGPAFGRLLPMPLMTPWAFEILFVVTLIFPLIGMIADHRRDGAIHPAWGWGLAAMVVALMSIELIAYSPVGLALYGAVTAGSPAAAVPPLDFPAAPAT